MQLGHLPRVALAVKPTPIQEAPRLSAYLGGPRILIKRDDLTGLAFGGNKARKLELLMGEARARNADVIITVGAMQSNHARMTAAAARICGMEAILVLSGEEPAELQGNLLLDHLLGAQVRLINSTEDYVLLGVVQDLSRELTERGRRPYVIPRGGSNGLGAAAYLEAGLEAFGQLNSMGLRADAIVHTSTSGGTQSGLLTAAKWGRAGARVVGVSAGPPTEAVVRRVVGIVRDLGKTVRTEWEVESEDVVVYDDYIGDGYGIPSAATVDAIKVLARTEGILLDPVYTGKGMAGLIDLVRRGEFRRNETVLFWHTGGQPALFAHADALSAPD
jgi:D-cysteine desulfhydrase family pyridoxal phosphate-dependent enzyme